MKAVCQFSNLLGIVILKICDGHIYKIRVIRDWPIHKTIVNVTTGIKTEENVKKKIARRQIDADF